MNSASDNDLYALIGRDLAAYGFHRARDLAYDAVQGLWQRRKIEGLTQVELAKTLGRDPAWVSKKLSGPGNWTLKTFGAFVGALNGEPAIAVRALEDPLRLNYHAYIGYERELPATSCLQVIQPREITPATHAGVNATFLTTTVSP